MTDNKDKDAHFGMTHILSVIAQMADNKHIEIVNTKGDSAEVLKDIDLKIDGQEFNVSITVSKM